MAAGRSAPHHRADARQVAPAGVAIGRGRHLVPLPHRGQAPPGSYYLNDERIRAGPLRILCQVVL